MNNWEQYARDLQDLGLVYDNDLRDPVKAISCYREAIELTKQLRAVDQLAALYNNMGALNWRQKKYRTALAYYQKGLAEMTIPSGRHGVYGDNTFARRCK